MKVICFLFMLVFICVCLTDAASRMRREEDTLEQLQKKLSEGFESMKKAAEEMAAKVDFKQMQEDITTKLDEIAKSLSDFTADAAEKKATESP